MTLILFAVSLSIALCVIAWHFAIYALPFMLGLAAFRYAHAADAGVAMSIAAALGAAGFSVMVAAFSPSYALLSCVSLSLRSSPRRLRSQATRWCMALLTTSSSRRSAQSPLRHWRPVRRHRRAAEHQRPRRRLHTALTLSRSSLLSMPC